MMQPEATILVTGGAGFIGSAVVRHLLRETAHRVVNVDKLTYAANPEFATDPGVPSADHRYHFERIDIVHRRDVERVFLEHRPDALMHLAAETHVDRSIDGPAVFMQTNILGTCTLLEVAAQYAVDHPAFRFHQISTDEVYGDLGDSGALFTEQTPYAPSSPYSASKAASDHLVRAWHRTYGLPVVISNCSNNYGPWQFPEKLIPLIILNALEGRPLPVYGQGQQIRDWLYVEDHARALCTVLTQGRIGETYNIGGHNEMSNLEVVENLCDLLQELHPPGDREAGREPAAVDPRFPDPGPRGPRHYRELITFVADRPGHDQRYAICAGKAHRELGWSPRETFATGLRKTVQWYLENLDWCHRIQQGRYQRERLGLGAGQTRQTAV